MAIRPAEAAGLNQLFRTTATVQPEEDKPVFVPGLVDLQPALSSRSNPDRNAQLPTLTEPTLEETVEPTAEVTVGPTADESAEPTMEATLDPSAEPTGEATQDPSAEPTSEGTAEPSPVPTGETTLEPTAKPTQAPVETITGSVRFTIDDTAVCQLGPGTFEATVDVSLSGGDAILQTAWRIAEPIDRRTPEVYTQHNVSDGDQVTISGAWPGVRPGDQVVEIHFGAVLLDPVTGNPISDGAGVDFYWYPWVCSIATPVVPTIVLGTQTPTTQPTIGETEVSLTETAEATITVTIQPTEGEGTQVFLTETVPATLTPTTGPTIAETEIVLTETATPTPTATVPTSTALPTSTPTPTLIPDTATATATDTATLVPDTATPTATNTATQIPDTATPTANNTATVAPDTATPTATDTATATEITIGQPFVGSNEQGVGGGVPVTGASEEDAATDGAFQATAVLEFEAIPGMGLQAPQPFVSGEEQIIPATGADLAPRSVPLTGLGLVQKTAMYFGLLLIGIAFVLQGLTRKP